MDTLTRFPPDIVQEPALRHGQEVTIVEEQLGDIRNGMGNTDAGAEVNAFSSGNLGHGILCCDGPVRTVKVVIVYINRIPIIPDTAGIGIIQPQAQIGNEALELQFILQVQATAERGTLPFVDRPAGGESKLHRTVAYIMFVIDEFNAYLDLVGGVNLADQIEAGGGGEDTAGVPGVAHAHAHS